MKSETALIETFSHDGRGIARINGKATFIQGALPGETVEFRYLRRKKAFDEGMTLSVITGSKHRVEPHCAHYGVCGGCSLQHLASAMQIHEKQALFLNILSRIGHCQPDVVLQPLQGPVWHYRHKARLSVRYDEKTASVCLGFREKNDPSHITDLQQCPVLHKRVDAELLNIRQLIASFQEPHSIAQVEVAVGDDEVALVFRHLSPLCKGDEESLIAFAERTHFRMFLQSGSLDTVSLFYPKQASEYLSYSLPSEGIEFHFHPTDFIQVNAALNRLMIPQALELLALKPEDRVLDLFCGLGNFSLPIAKYCTKVMGIEGSDRMVQRARMNAANNQVTHVEFLKANLYDESVFALLYQQQANKILLDPPRAGAFEIVKCIEKMDPQRVVYVSCNPATFARDADILVNEKGYRLTQAGVMDMFPHTEHVESIALFEQDPKR